MKSFKKFTSQLKERKRQRMTNVNINVKGAERGVALALLAVSKDKDDKKTFEKVKQTARLQDAFQAEWFEKYDQLAFAHLEHGRQLLGFNEEDVEERDGMSIDARREVQEKQRACMKASREEMCTITVREDDATYLREAVEKYAGSLPPGLSRDLTRLYAAVDDAIAESKRETPVEKGA